MTQYIDKSVVVAEILKRQERNKRNKLNLAAAFEDNYLLSFLDTLKVKEMDLEKEINLWVEDNTCRGYCSASIHETAEHFFEFGLKVAQKGE